CGRPRRLRGQGHLPRRVLGAARARHQAPAARAAGEGRRPHARRNGRGGSVLRLRRNVRREIRGHLDPHRRREMRPDRGDRGRCRGPRRSGLHAQHRGPPAPPRRRGNARPARGGGPRRGRRRHRLMQVASMHFKPRAAEKLADPQLRAALDGLKRRFVPGRAAVMTELDFAATREAAASIRSRSIDHLDHFLELFERNATARGAVVHWAETVEDVNAIVLAIARENGVRKAVKSKSMVSEECALNDALEAAGIEVVETDLGEYILQLNREPPSHIIAPVIHKTRDQVSDLFAEKHGTARKTDIDELTCEARERLRPHFLDADMGITGANFIVAETGSTLIVTNEGNGRMATTLPRIHVAITGIEKVVPTLEDVATLMRLLPRSATGQSISNYVSITTGTRAEGDLEGPEQFHVVLLDGGRSKILASEIRAILRCIRCGACMNHCPVYQSV